VQVEFRNPGQSAAAFCLWNYRIVWESQSLRGAVFAAVAAGHLEIYARVEFAVRD
jgi:hypothetical protein